MQALGLDEATQPFLRDAEGNPTGAIKNRASGAGRAAARRPPATRSNRSTRRMIRSRGNRAGLTAFGRASTEADALPLDRRLAEQVQLHVRANCITCVTARSPEQVERALLQIPRMQVRQGDAFINYVAYGEGEKGVTAALPTLRQGVHPVVRRPGAVAAVAAAIANAGLPLHVHANLTARIDAFLERDRVNDREASCAGTCAGRWRTSTSWYASRSGSHEAAPSAGGDPFPGSHQRRHYRLVFGAGACDINRCCGGCIPGERGRAAGGQRRQPRESGPAVHDAVVGGDGEDGRRHDGAAPDHRPQGRARRAHAAATRG